MVKYGFENALVVKNADGRTVSQLLAAAIKQRSPYNRVTVGMDSSYRNVVVPRPSSCS